MLTCWGLQGICILSISLNISISNLAFTILLWFSVGGASTCREPPPLVYSSRCESSFDLIWFHISVCMHSTRTSLKTFKKNWTEHPALSIDIWKTFAQSIYYQDLSDHITLYDIPNMVKGFWLIFKILKVSPKLGMAAIPTRSPRLAALWERPPLYSKVATKLYWSVHPVNIC